MSQLPNPSEGKPFERVIKDDQDRETWGIRNEGTKDEEIVYIPTGESNMKYYQPEMYLNPTKCKHEFTITHVGKREIECEKCHLETSFVVGVNTFEIGGRVSILLGGKKYPLKAVTL